MKHLKAKQKKLAKQYRIKNKAKLKKRAKKKEKLLKHKPKKKGFSYGADGKLKKIVRRRGVRFKK